MRIEAPGEEWRLWGHVRGRTVGGMNTCLGLINIKLLRPWLYLGRGRGRGELVLDPAGHQRGEVVVVLRDQLGDQL